MANPFASLADSDDESVQEVAMTIIDPRCGMETERNTRESANEIAGFGGDIAMRVDPLVASHKDLSISGVGFSDSELEITIKVVEALGANLHLFKLPNMRPLRKALQVK